MYWKRYFKSGGNTPNRKRGKQGSCYRKARTHKCSRRSIKIYGNDENARVEKYSEIFYFVVEKNLMVPKVPVKMFHSWSLFCEEWVDFLSSSLSEDESEEEEGRCIRWRPEREERPYASPRLLL